MSDAVADRFSDLPDALIHQIYSFLDMKEVLGTTLLSKRWRYLWRSLTNLNFNQPTKCSIEDKKSSEFVEQVLLRRDAPNIHKLCLSNHSCTRERLLAWLDSAIRQHVQEIHIENRTAPYSFSGEVKTLVLKNCRYTGETFMISSSRLNHLIVDSAYDNKCCKIVLRAPNLTTLRLKGNMFGGYSMDNLSALVTAEIIDVHITDMYSRTREVSRSCFSCIFNGVRNVESLRLPTHCLKFLLGIFHGLEVVPISFNNVKHLMLTEWRERSYMNIMAKLFGCFPNIENLILERTEAYGSEKEGDWEAVLSSDSIFGPLKVVEIRKFDGSKNEFKFLEFLLNNAMVLEHITMKVTTTLSEEKAKDLVDLCKTLHTMSKASPSVAIRLIMMKIERRCTILFEEPSSSLFESPLPVLNSPSLSNAETCG